MVSKKEVGGNTDGSGDPVAERGTCTAFAGDRHLMTGHRVTVLLAAQEVRRITPDLKVLVFDDRTGEALEWDSGDRVSSLSGPVEGPSESGGGERVLAGPTVARKPGRPRLGVVAREVTLLPRHWDWLTAQPGGASVAIRRLVEMALRSSRGEDDRRRAREAAYRFMSVAAGNLPGFEEAIRALFRGESERFTAELAPWPVDLRNHACRLATASFQ